MNELNIIYESTHHNTLVKLLKKIPPKIVLRLIIEATTSPQNWYTATSSTMKQEYMELITTLNQAPRL